MISKVVHGYYRILLIGVEECGWGSVIVVLAPNLYARRVRRTQLVSASHLRVCVCVCVCVCAAHLDA